MEQGKVWSPEIKFNNPVHSEGDEPIQSGLFVVRRTNGDQNSKEELVMREIFSGAENPFQKIEVYELDLNCALTNLSRYPFDTEICPLVIQVVGNDHRRTRLIPKQLKYNGPQGLANYVIEGESKFRKDIFVHSAT